MTVAVRLSDSPVLVMDHEFRVTILADLASPADRFDFSVEVRGSAARATRFYIPAAGRGWCDVNGFPRHIFHFSVVVAEALYPSYRASARKSTCLANFFSLAFEAHVL